MKNFINIADIGKKDLREIIDNAKSQKLKRSILNNLDKLQSYSSDDLLERRYKRLSGFGAI